jgi:hypothetical protein
LNDPWLAARLALHNDHLKSLSSLVDRYLDMVNAPNTETTDAVYFQGLGRPFSLMELAGYLVGRSGALRDASEERRLEVLAVRDAHRRLAKLESDRNPR